MVRKRVLAAIALVFVVFIGFSIIPRDQKTDPEYIINVKSPVKIERADVRKFRKKTEFPLFFDETPYQEVKEEKKALQSEQNLKAPRINDFVDAINSETLKYFRYLHRKSRKSKTMEEHLALVLKHLKSQLGDEQAAKIMEIYNKYLECEIELEQELLQRNPPQDTYEAIEMLRQIHEFRRKQLGVDLADTLFGAEVKSSEYALRKALITQDEELYGQEKEQKIEELSVDMWGDEGELINSDLKPYQRYQQKLSLYARDLREMDASEKDETIAQFRQNHFPENVVQELENIDHLMASEKQVEIDYYQKEATINKNKNLSEEERISAINELQEEVFGDDVEAFRRRESIRKGLEELKAGKNN